ncbi:pyruvate carboxylase [Paralimibaculum aggregatum]|uniref:Pyruvate carboxylase n=1 Tax=Paralimibaculum aggregatum TaxID=3036245 RepID=A0ABQ6LQ26_9RHOB|nr:pyruvate carboxylase [Limibaculum sp. NKW23]GMG84729.1 pyruvate carboxylase [Limibaculum sp. NKW23]
MPTFQKILVANRGEIAIRVMRAANELGKRTVAIYAEEDKLGLHRFKADEAYQVGAGRGPVAAYLDIDDIMRIARESGADALHPGYGLLSENPDLVDACTAAGIAFIGPSADTMRMLGDKASARQAAIAAGVPVIPASDVLPDVDAASPAELEAIRARAEEIGYPLMLKASWGGGGRGMRPIQGPDELVAKLREGRSEATQAFGKGDGYLEKLIQRARHVEVQILGDRQGEIYHLWERDCTVQRRNQKVVERAPAPYLTRERREELCGLALKIARHAGYACAGTVEFLMDMDSGAFYFIEVNPRIQVEHTVTEEVTGIDIVRAQIRITEGASIAEATGAASQADVVLKGHAIQCRVTTEDPTNNFVPDYGRITAYRGATGFGIRLDGGTAYSGAVITRYYDSLLEKVTAWAPTPEQAVARMDRALREFRIRGVATNIVFVENLLKHPSFIDQSYTTRFIDTTPELFVFPKRRDRATKLLRYIAEVTVNGNPEVAGRPRLPAHARPPVAPHARVTPPLSGTRELLLAEGPKGVADWMLKQDRLLITDTTMRDSHQSLLATRMRSVDMLRVAPAYAGNLPGLFSMECWGGATFDVAYRFLQECPWQRLRELRERMPNLLTQMLLRASNAVGYTNYPDNVVQHFIDRAAKTGIDVFRIFDPLNWVESMRVAMDQVIETGKICEASICYTGDIHDPDRAKYSLAYYVGLAKELEAAGAHILCIKDMGGLVKPAAAEALVRALKNETSLPVHFHTHDTSGISAASILAASAAGVDAVDLAMDALSGVTSQPPLGSVVAALRNQPRDTGLDAGAIREISAYWEGVRRLYAGFESEMRSGTAEVYSHEMPGGQVTNLRAQARSMGLEERWDEVAAAYADVNRLFGDVIKVTPIAKTVGDMALTLVAGGHKAEDLLDPDMDISVPDSVLAFFRGEVGQPHGGFPEALQKRLLKGAAPLTVRPGSLMEPVDLEARRAEAMAEMEGHTVDDEDLASYLIYPKVYLDYMGRRRDFGPVRVLPTPTFFYGMEPREEIHVDLRPGVTLVIRLQAISEPDEKGEVKLFFELNGQPRTVRVADRRFEATARRAEQAEPGNPLHLPAPMPGVVGSVAVTQGQTVHAGDVLMTLEAMKMETAIIAERDGVIERVVAAAGTQVDAKDLLLTFAG